MKYLCYFVFLVFLALIKHLGASPCLFFYVDTGPGAAPDHSSFLCSWKVFSLLFLLVVAIVPLLSPSPPTPPPVLRKCHQIPPSPLRHFQTFLLFSPDLQTLDANTPSSNTTSFCCEVSIMYEPVFGTPPSQSLYSIQWVQATDLCVRVGRSRAPPLVTKSLDPSGHDTLVSWHSLYVSSLSYYQGFTPLARLSPIVRGENELKEGVSFPPILVTCGETSPCAVSYHFCYGLFFFRSPFFQILVSPLSSSAPLCSSPPSDACRGQPF